MKLTKEIMVKADQEVVYKAYADICLWKEVLPDVVGVAINYDDGHHQEFDMTVKRGEQEETVHSVRFCYPCCAIEIFQTKPPPLFKSMGGVWRFIGQREGCLVRATREFEMKPGMQANAALLDKFLEHNLLSFKTWIESHVHTS